MTTPSSNWKKLSKKLSRDKLSSKDLTISNKDVRFKKGKVGKIVKNTSKSYNKEKLQKAVSEKKTESKANGPNKEESVSMDALEASLWTNENEIVASNIIRERTNVSLLSRGNRKREPGKYLAIDCEFVGVGENGKESALARVSIVNFYGHVVYDKFVKPQEKVIDWRTWVSGVSSKDMSKAVAFQEAQNEVSGLLLNKILVGHAVQNDLEALFLSHPKLMIRDTSQFPGFREISSGKQPSLKKLSSHFLNIPIQNGSHSSIDDARATMLLFRLKRKEIENQPRLKHHVKK